MTTRTVRSASPVAWPAAAAAPARLPTDVRVGIVGTGYTARGLAHVLGRTPRLSMSSVLTRRPLDEVDGPWAGLLTHSTDRLVAQSDLVVVTTGDAVHGTEV